MTCIPLQSACLALLSELSKRPLSEQHPMAWSLLAQQAERNGVQRRELLECCNQEAFYSRSSGSMHSDVDV